MKFDALPIANSSWLKAILWAFIFALREKAIEAYGGNPFPLVLLDDPQTTFDPRNKRKWAQELARVAGLDERDANSVQLFLTTNERWFFTQLTEIEGIVGQEGLIAQADEETGHIVVVNGNILERDFRAVGDNDAKARAYIRQVRIYLEKLLKYILRGEGPDIAGSNLQAMCRELKNFHKDHVTPFNRRPFTELVKFISGGERPVQLINNPPHDDDETIGVAEAVDVHDYWESTLRNKIHIAFHAYAAFEAHHGDPRIFDYPDNIIALPTGMSEQVRKAVMVQTGMAAAATTDGRVGDGELRIEEWEEGEKVSLHNHEVYRLTANTLVPVATIGNLIIVSNYAQVDGGRKHLVAAAVGDRLLARRLQISEIHPDMAILTAQAVNPYELAAPVIVPIEGLEMKKVVGTLFTSNVGADITGNELEMVENSDEFLSVLGQARLFKVQGRSAEPIALEDQFLIVDTPVDDPRKWGEFDGRLVIGIDIDGGSYFKRLRSPRAGLYVLESLNPDGTTPAELLSIDGREGAPQLAQVLPVLGVLFEVP